VAASSNEKETEALRRKMLECDQERGGIQAEAKAGERGAREEVMRLESELGSSSEKVTRLEGELGALKEEVVRLEGECTRLEGERVEGTRAVRDLERRLSSFKTQLEVKSPNIC
jgi:chromosome segregation ATPase